MNRSHESPMEFEWDNQHGPSDPNSPFAAVSGFNKSVQNEVGRKRHLNSPHVSPSKNVPKFGTPSSTPYFFNTPIKPANPSTLNSRQNNNNNSSFQTPAFTTPRKFETPGTDISGAEDSPAAPESAPDTPDMNTPEKGKNSRSASPIKKRPSFTAALFGGLSIGKKSKSSGKELVVARKGSSSHSSSNKPYSDAAAKKVQKKRQRMGSEGDNFFAGGHSDNESADEKHYGDGKGKRGRKGVDQKQQQQSSRMNSFNSMDAASWADAHRDVPSVISQYLQLGVNVSIGCLGLYLIFGVVSAIQRDINNSVTKAIEELEHEIAICQREWIANRCDPSTRAPALQEQCRAWELCAGQTAGLVGRASVTAETFAHIINSFVEQISYKSMVFCFLMVFGVIFASNFAFGFFRAKQVHHPNPFLAAAAPALANHYNNPQSIGWGSSQGYATPTKNPNYVGYRTPYKTPYSFDDINEDIDAFDRAMHDEKESPVPEKKRMLQWQ